MVSFVKADTENIEELLKIYNHYVEHSTATFHIGKVDREEFQGMILFKDELYCTYVIYDDETITGYCLIMPFSPRQAYRRTAEVSIYIRPEKTGKGYGQAALKFLVEHAGEKGIKSLIAKISADNTISIKLFEKNGFKKVGCLYETGEKFGMLLDVAIYQKQL